MAAQRRNRARSRCRRRSKCTSNIAAETRSLIVKTGYRLLERLRIKRGLSGDSDPKIKYTEIQKCIGTIHNEQHSNLIDKRTIKTWWDRRFEFEVTGQLR